MPESIRGLTRVLAGVLAGLLALLACAPTLAAGANRIIHEERSLYRHIQVKQRGSVRCMVFSIRSDDRNQTCIDLDDRRRMVFPYAQMMMTALLVHPEPGRILIIGLGGGTLPTALHELYPAAAIDVVEIDPAVARVARSHFGFEAPEGTEIHIRDARVFVKRRGLELDRSNPAAKPGQRYDLIMLDAFNGDYIPEHLMTAEFLEECKALLTPDGVLAANTFASSQLYHHESTTYELVFDHLVNVRHPVSLNRVLLARDAPFPSRAELQARAGSFRKRFEPYDVPTLQLPSWMHTERDWDPDARPLTDEYAPANLLRERR